MLFKVKNLGVIAEAEVDLSKDLILLTGQNNTGKTYLAYAIYWFLQLDFNHFVANSLDDLYNIAYDRHQNINPKSVVGEGIIALATNLATKKKIKIDIDYVLDNIVIPKYEETMEKILSLITLFEYNLPLFMMNKTVEQTTIKLHIPKQEIKNNLARIILDNRYLDMNQLLMVNVREGYFEFITKMKDIDYLANGLGLCLFGGAFFRNYTNNYCFTAERSAINIFSKELTLLGNKILRSKDKNLINFATERINRYPQPIKDSLDIAEDLKALAKKTSEFAYLAEELEKSILKGNIVVGEFDDLQYKPNGVENNLEIHLTSSLVKSLSPIAFYLRHLAQKNDCIIIDEPELNLHPDNQILVARFLGRLVNEGFKVIVSTHSDYIIKEINNLVMLSKESEVRNELLEKYGYSEKETIKPEQIEALLFRLPKNGGMVTPEKIAITPTGLSIKTIDEVIDKLDTMTENIYYKLFENEAN